MSRFEQLLDRVCQWASDAVQALSELRYLDSHTILVAALLVMVRVAESCVHLADVCLAWVAFLRTVRQALHSWTSRTTALLRLGSLNWLFQWTVGALVVVVVLAVAVVLLIRRVVKQRHQPN
jgi:hypothetical protein